MNACKLEKRDWDDGDDKEGEEEKEKGNEDHCETLLNQEETDLEEVGEEEARAETAMVEAAGEEEEEEEGMGMDAIRFKLIDWERPAVEMIGENVCMKKRGNEWRMLVYRDWELDAFNGYQANIKMWT